MRKRDVLLLSTVALLAGIPIVSAAAGEDDLLGVWLNQEQDAKIELYRCGEKYCGKVVWLKEPNYPEGSLDGVPGTPKLDHHNPAGELRTQPIIGLTIVRDMAPDGDNRWLGGTVYDPKNGKTYRGKLTLISPKRLDLRGYIGITLIGRTATWTR